MHPRTRAVLAFPKDSEAQLALRSGKVVADLLDSVTAVYVAQTADGGSTFVAIDDRNAVGPADPSPMGIGIAKDAPPAGCARPCGP